MKNLLLILFCLLFCPTVKAEVAWFDGTNPVTYQVDGKVDAVVQIALRMFCNDMELVTGHKTVESKNAVIRIVQGKGLDDGFRISVTDGQVVIEGHNARGTAYGLLELSRMAGVSPWVWWGDVRPYSLHRLSLPEYLLNCVGKSFAETIFFQSSATVPVQLGSPLETNIAEDHVVFTGTVERTMRPEPVHVPPKA